MKICTGENVNSGKIAVLFLFALATVISCNKDEDLHSLSSGTDLSATVNTAFGYGTFTFSNKSSNKVMQVSGADSMLYDYDLVQQATYTGTGIATAPNQKWIIIPQNIQLHGYPVYRIMNIASGKFLTSPNNNIGAQLLQYRKDSSLNQLWHIQALNNAYIIINAGNTLAVVNKNGSSENFTAITQEKFVNTNTAAYWTITKIPDESYRDDDVVNFFHRPKIENTTVAFDQGNSIPLTFGNNNGKSLWITEDCYTWDELKDNGLLNCWFFKYHNSALLQPAGSNWDPAQTPNITTHNSTAGNLEIIASPGDHSATYSWPGVGVELNNHVYLFCWESANGSIPENQVLYDLTENDNGLDWGTAIRTTPKGMSGQTTIVYSNGMVKSNDGYVYAYGSKGVGLGSYIYLARFPKNNTQQWQFWNGTTWNTIPDPQRSAAIKVGPAASTQANTAISYVNGKYVMMTMDLGYFCDPAVHNIYISTATSPQGPFTQPKLVFTINDIFLGHLARYYTPAIHPQFNNEHNELLVTYCLNYSACAQSACVNNSQDPNFYQVKGVRIPYSLIGL